MRLNEVSQITQRMVFLRVYEVLVEANQSVLDRRDYVKDLASSGLTQSYECYNAGYPFCYFTGEVLNDLLQQPIIWREQHLILEDAVKQLQPDLNEWLTDSVRHMSIVEFFSWQPHTLKVQELVDDVKQRVLDVVDAIHSAEKLQALPDVPQILHILPNRLKARHIVTGGIRHSLSYRLAHPSFQPVVHDAKAVNAKWYMHALIHGMWLITQYDGHIKIDTQEKMVDDCESERPPLYIV